MSDRTRDDGSDPPHRDRFGPFEVLRCSATDAAVLFDDSECSETVVATVSDGSECSEPVLATVSDLSLPTTMSHLFSET